MQVEDKAPGDEAVQTPDIPVSDEPSHGWNLQTSNMWQKQAYCRPTSFPPLPSNYQEQEAQGGTVSEVAGPLQELCRGPHPPDE